MIEFPIHIIGNGAIGSLIAANAIQHNIKPIQIVRPHSLEHSHVNLGDVGISLTNKMLISQVPEIDVLVVPVKAFDVESVLIDVKPLLKPGAQVIISHNGLGTLEASKRIIGDIADIYFCTTSTGAYKDGDTVIRSGVGQSQWSVISLCSFKTKARKLIGQIIDALFYNSSYVDNLNTVLWNKLAVNSVINPITAIDNINNGDVLQTKYEPLIDAILRELLLVATRSGVSLSPQQLKETVIEVARNTKANSSSMRQDVLLNQQTEIDFINGYIVTLAAQLNIDVPVNRTLVEKVKELVLL